MMKIIFAGTPEISAFHLKTLIHSDQHEVIAILTQIDRPAGRGRKLTLSPVKQLAQQHNIPVYQPTSLRSPEIQITLQSLEADIMIVVAYGMLIPQSILDMPRHGCLNVHVSLLPRWRGAAPIQHAILSGDKTSGITIMQMDAGLDTGDILLQHATPIEKTDTGQTLHDKLMFQGAKQLLTVLDAWPYHYERRIPQSRLTLDTLDPSSEISYAKKLLKSEGLIDWQQTAQQIDQQIRAFSPWPSAYTVLTNGQTLKIHEANVIHETPTDLTDLPPGSTLQSSKKGIQIQTAHGILNITKAQLPGKKIMPVADLLNGLSEPIQIRCTHA